MRGRQRETVSGAGKGTVGDASSVFRCRKPRECARLNVVGFLLCRSGPQGAVTFAEGLAHASHASDACAVHVVVVVVLVVEAAAQHEESADDSDDHGGPTKENRVSEHPYRVTVTSGGV